MLTKICYCYYLTHRYIVQIGKDGEPICETKEIGVYSTKRKAMEAIQRFKKLSGFRDYPEGFLIQKKACYLESKNKPDLDKVFSPYHEEYLSESDCDYVTRGVFFENSHSAEEVIQEWKKKSKFIGCEEGFAVIEYTLDKDIRLWSEGFLH